jgi:hypothetical protein
MRALKTITAAALLAAWGTANAVSLTLVADNTRSSSGTLSYQVFQTCTPPSNVAGTGCSRFLSSWQVTNGVTGSTATWDWDGTTLTATGMFQSTSHISSNPNGNAVISDKTVNLTINTATMTTTATSYNCIEGNFLGGVGAHGCFNTGLGADFVNDSSALYNVGGNAACINRTVGGDDTIGSDDDPIGNPRGLVSRAAGGGCDATDGAYDLWTIVSDNTGTGGQLVLSNGINIASAGTHFMTFQAVPAPPALWLLGSGVVALAGRRLRRKSS